MHRAPNDDFVSISTVLDELEKDLSPRTVEKKPETAASGKEAILKVLARAADDHKFLARLAENPAKVLKEYDLTSEERVALASGDLRRIESWVGKLDKRMCTWIWCRLQQEKW
jgi:hypothetical protein